jgi:hypothetical protein
MRLFTEEFVTAAEARAFVAGAELANDSDLACHEPRETPNGMWVVHAHDWGVEMEDDECPLCGAGGKERGCEDAQADLQARMDLKETGSPPDPAFDVEKE